MRPLLLASFALVIASAAPALAGKLTCSFAEPFYGLEFDSATGIVVATSPVEGEEGKRDIIARDARLRLAGEIERMDVYALENASGTILELRVTGRGSDGVSETVFPFEGRHGGNVGGCQASKAPAYDTSETFHDLGVSYD